MYFLGKSMSILIYRRKISSFDIFTYRDSLLLLITRIKSTFFLFKSLNLSAIFLYIYKEFFTKQVTKGVWTNSSYRHFCRGLYWSGLKAEKVLGNMHFIIIPLYDKYSSCLHTKPVKLLKGMATAKPKNKMGCPGSVYWFLTIIGRKQFYFFTWALYQ